MLTESVDNREVTVNYLKSFGGIVNDTFISLFQISVYYSGRLKSTNKVFDELTTGPGLSFRLGKGEVIDGWDIGVVGMKVGGKRIISCPPAMA